MEPVGATLDFTRMGLVDPEPVPFGAVAGFDEDDIREAFGSFLSSCERIAASDAGLRPGVAPDPVLARVCADALRLGPDAPEAAIRAFVTGRFEVRRVIPSNGAARGFLTGYYEPIIEGSWTRREAFSEPLLAKPDDLVTLRPGDDWGGLDKRLSGARRGPDGELSPYWSRADIETASAGRYQPLVWVRDPVEAFMIQVQGSATIRVDGELVRLTYAGRNGRPYTSIGRILIERGDISQRDMSLARLKQWARDQGQRPGEPGRDLLWRNESFVFFAIDQTPARRFGPIGAAGTPLRPLRSIAVDRAIWPYGLMFWIAADIPWRDREVRPFRRLMVAQDTGSAIIGSARADIYIGAGDAAGAIAGDIRHSADIYVLLPREPAEGGR